jgi:hypothetical protein
MEDTKMEKAIIREIGEVMANKGAIINRYRKENPETNNIRKFPFYSEFYGMIQMLKIMGVEYDIEWDSTDLDRMTAIIISGEKFDI